MNEGSLHAVRYLRLETIRFRINKQEKVLPYHADWYVGINLGSNGKENQV
jgi:hypothetical protein